MSHGLSCPEISYRIIATAFHTADKVHAVRFEPVGSAAVYPQNSQQKAKNLGFEFFHTFFASIMCDLPYTSPFSDLSDYLNEIWIG
jgi:hypothetical protein